MNMRRMRTLFATHEKYHSTKLAKSKTCGRDYKLSFLIMLSIQQFVYNFDSPAPLPGFD